MSWHGHTVAVLSLGTGGPLSFWNETTGYADVAKFGLENLPVLRLTAAQMPMQAVIAEALSFARLHGIELIDAHVAREPAEVACDLHLATGIPYCIRLRGGDVHSRTSLRLPEIVEHASAICPMSQFLADVLTGKVTLKKTPVGIPVSVNPGKLHVIVNSLPAEYLADVPKLQHDDRQIVGAIGRLVPMKRFHDLIRAVAELASAYPALKLMIIGGGILASELQQLAATLGIANRVEITGFKTWEEVMTLIKQLDIYVQASELEGCSLATLEAAFQGIPLVLSKTGANEQCVEHGINGYLFDAFDQGMLRENLHSLLKAGARKREQMGAATLKIVGRRFSAETVLPKIEAIFRAVIEHDRLGKAAEVISQYPGGVPA